MSHAQDSNQDSTPESRGDQPGRAGDDPRLIQAVQEYMQHLDQGRTPDRESFLARYADLGSELEECLGGLEFIHRAAPLPLPGVSDAAGTGASLAGALHAGNPLGDFKIVREIGRGGMGIVYEAVQLSLDRRVALKVLPFAATFDTQHLQRFRHEAQAAAQLHHNNIVPVYAVGCERGVHFYAMQLIEGQSLDAVIRQLRHQAGMSLARLSPPLSDADATGSWNPPSETAGPDDKTEVGPPPETMSQLSIQLSNQRSSRENEFFRFVARCMAQTAEALEYAHQQGIVHRDIKPGNLLVDDRGKMWITDFGLAHFHAGTGLTQTGDVLGTLRYMSPEQAAGQKVVLDHRTDIYSLGATFYELLTLQPIFNGATRQTLLDRVLNHEPAAPCAIDRRIPVELETILLKTLSKSPADRYPWAQALADDLYRFLRDEPIHARRPSPAEYVRKWMRRHPAVLAAGTVALLLVLVISLVSNWRIAQANSRTAQALRQERLRAEQAERRFDQARRAVDLLVDVCEKDLAGKPPAQALRKRLLETAMLYYQDLISERREDPQSQAELMAVRERITRLLDELTVMEGAGQLLLLAESQVQRELDLTPDQRTRVEKMNREFTQTRLDSLPELRRLSPEQRRGRFLQWARNNERAMQETLSAAQLRRLSQIAIQLHGPMAFKDPQVTARLRLTDQQRQQIHQIEMEGMASMWDHVLGEGRETAPETHPKDIRDDTMRRIVDCLTPEQQTAWQTLIGKPVAELQSLPARVLLLPIIEGAGP